MPVGLNRRAYRPRSTIPHVADRRLRSFERSTRQLPGRPPACPRVTVRCYLVADWPPAGLLPPLARACRRASARTLSSRDPRLIFLWLIERFASDYFSLSNYAITLSGFHGAGNELFFNRIAVLTMFPVTVALTKSLLPRTVIVKPLILAALRIRLLEATQVSATTATTAATSLAGSSASCLQTLAFNTQCAARSCTKSAKFP